MNKSKKKYNLKGVRRIYITWVCQYDDYCFNGGVSSSSWCLAYSVLFDCATPCTYLIDLQMLSYSNNTLVESLSLKLLCSSDGKVALLKPQRSNMELVCRIKLRVFFNDMQHDLDYICESA